MISLWGLGYNVYMCVCLCALVRTCMCVCMSKRKKWISHKITNKLNKFEILYLQNTILQTCNCLDLRNITRSVTVTLKTQSVVWQPYDIYIQFQILHTRCYVDPDEWVSVAQRVKMNVTANNKHYSLIGTEVEFCGIY